MCVKLFKLIDSEMKVYYVPKVLKQGFNIKTMYPHYLFELRNMKSQWLSSSVVCYQMTSYFEEQKCLNKRRRIDDCLREVLLK